VEDGKKCRLSLRLSTRTEYASKDWLFLHASGISKSGSDLKIILGGITLEIRPIWSINSSTLYPLLPVNKKISIDVDRTKCLWTLGDLKEAVPLYIVSFLKLR